MGTRLYHNLCFFLLISTFLNLVSGFCPNPNKGRFLFIFGDQNFDVGNNNHFETVAQANFWPYGDTFFKYPSGRFSNGRLICDFIAQYMGLPLIPPYLEGDIGQFIYGANFASALSGALSFTDQQFPVKPLRTQIDNFKNLTTILREKIGDGPLEEMVSNALYLFSVGSNDYFAPFFPYNGQYGTEVPYYNNNEGLAGWVVQTMMDVTTEIYDMGGRKFGYLNVGPLDRFPYFQPLPRSMQYSHWDAHYLALYHNMGLSSALEQMKKQNDGFRYAIHNLFDSISGRIDNPSQNGFKVGDVACCGSESNNGDMTCGGRGGYMEYTMCDNPTDYVFFDGLDLSEKANKQIAELFWNGTSYSTGPENLKSMLD